MNTVLVTGATGNVGSEVVLALAGKANIRAAVTDVEKAKGRLPPGTEAVRFDFEDASTFAGAFAGVDRLFLMRPPHISDPKVIAPSIEAAKAAGVKQIIFLSLQGAESNSIVPHAKIEKLLLTCGVPYTFLRPSFFMQNLTGQHRDEIRQRGEIFVPAGRGRTSFIDARDIAAVAALALTEDGHENKAYTLTGSEALTYDEVAQILTEVTGRPVRYANPNLVRFVLQKRREGLAWGFVIVMAGIYLTAALGRADGLTDEVPRLLGRAPITVRQFVQDYRSVWLS
ncbi:MAG: SDR family oxidoreductase [Pleurocapsa minor GSE-CHR-MK-17-07R]|jgi:uncharacterized protein YbjT (DUF2867 family)|nr:SDR family oxidoreductase [Pleurocapsa minor GSE-CHR-MK 17-07R]